MKKLLLTLIFLQFIFSSFAQNVNTKYDTCQLLSQYQGEWRYTNGLDTIRMYFRYHRDYSPLFNWVSDKLYGWLEYKSGNTIIESNYPNRNMLLPATYVTDSINVNLYSAWLSLKECSNSYPILSGTIIDHMQANEIHMVTAVINANKTAILWKQTHGEGYGHGTGATGMTLPREFPLVKQ